MNKSVLGLAALILASPAFSDESRINTTRDSGGYEATLRQADLPLSGGLAWATHSQVPRIAAPIQQASIKATPAREVVAKVAKAAKDS